MCTDPAAALSTVGKLCQGVAATVAALVAKAVLVAYPLVQAVIPAYTCRMVVICPKN